VFCVVPGICTLPLNVPLGNDNVMVNLLLLLLMNLLLNVNVTSFVNGVIRFPPSKIITPLERLLASYANSLLDMAGQAS
jgi:hypothetical protein